MPYEYHGKVYHTKDDIDDAIEAHHASDYNNREVPEHIYEYDWNFEVEVVEDDSLIEIPKGRKGK